MYFNFTEPQVALIAKNIFMNPGPMWRALLVHSDKLGRLKVSKMKLG
jgi:hypothetical protein